MRIAPILLALLGIAAVAVAVVDRVLRPQTGPLALAAVVEPHLLLVGGIAAAIAVLSVLGSRSGAARWVRLAGVVAIVGAVVVLGGEWWSPPPVPGARRGQAAGHVLEPRARVEGGIDERRGNRRTRDGRRRAPGAHPGGRGRDHR